MADVFIKIDEFGFKRVRSITNEETQNFSIDYLNSEKSRIRNQITNLNLDLVEIDFLFQKAAELGVKPQEGANDGSTDDDSASDNP